MDTLKMFLSFTVVGFCVTSITCFSKASEPSPTCEPNAIFTTKVERRYVQALNQDETRRQLFVLSEYFSQTNVAAAGFIQLKNGEYIELDESGLLSAGSSESVTSFEISEDGSVYIGYVRDPETLIEVPAAPSTMVPAPEFAQSLIFDLSEILNAAEIAFSPKEQEDAIKTLRKETENSGEEIKICSGKIETIIFTARPGRNEKSDKSMQVKIELEVQI